MPNLIHILLDGAVRGELAARGRVHNSLLRPALFILVGFLHTLVSLRIGAEILQDK